MASTLTLAGIKNELRVGLGGRTDQDGNLATWINQAQRTLADCFDWPEFRYRVAYNLVITATPATDKIVNDSQWFAPLFPAGAGYVGPVERRNLNSFRLTDASLGIINRKLDFVEYQRWDEVIPYPEVFARSIPTFYTEWGPPGAMDIEIYPVPVAAYACTFRGSRYPRSFDDSDQTKPSEFNDSRMLALIEFALQHACQSLGMVEDAKGHEAKAGMLWGNAAKSWQSKPDKRIALQPGRKGGFDSKWAIPYWQTPYIMRTPR